VDDSEIEERLRELVELMNQPAWTLERVERDGGEWRLVLQRLKNILVVTFDHDEIAQNLQTEDTDKYYIRHILGGIWQFTDAQAERTLEVRAAMG
jgi:hypothetical protein